MTGAGLSRCRQHPVSSSVKPHKNPWFIITSEELDTIRHHLAEMEPKTPEECRERTREISRIIDIVERRLA